MPLLNVCHVANFSTQISHYDLCIGTSGDDAVVKNRIQANFPPECQTLFEYITSFLRELCKPENNQGKCVYIYRVAQLLHL